MKKMFKNPACLGYVYSINVITVNRFKNIDNVFNFIGGAIMRLVLINPGF